MRDILQSRYLRSNLAHKQLALKADWQGFNRRILAACGIVTENDGYFTDFELTFERKNNPTFLIIPQANYGRNMKKFGFSSCATYFQFRLVIVDILS